jgi:hypothetical protein
MGCKAGSSEHSASALHPIIRSCSEQVSPRRARTAKLGCRIAARPQCVIFSRAERLHATAVEPPAAAVLAQRPDRGVRANTGCEHSQHTNVLFDHLVGALLELQRHVESK